MMAGNFLESEEREKKKGGKGGRKKEKEWVGERVALSYARLDVGKIKLKKKKKKKKKKNIFDFIFKQQNPKILSHTKNTQHQN